MIYLLTQRSHSLQSPAHSLMGFLRFHFRTFSVFLWCQLTLSPMRLLIQACSLAAQLCCRSLSKLVHASAEALLACQCLSQCGLSCGFHLHTVLAAIHFASCSASSQCSSSLHMLHGISSAMHIHLVLDTSSMHSVQ